MCNQYPELFKAAVADVPFVDILNTMSDPTIPLTVTEWEEWLVCVYLCVCACVFIYIRIVCINIDIRIHIYT
jgi:hypothetical protein